MAAERRASLAHLVCRDASFYTREMHVDIETLCELNLKTVALGAYSRHPSARIILVSWAFGIHPVSQWRRGEPPPEEFIEALLDPHCLKISHNSQFERVMLRECWLIDTPIGDWRCTMTWAYMIGLPGALEKLGPVLKIPLSFQKFAQGRRLIGIFCKPNKLTKKRDSVWRDETTDPEAWEEFCQYNQQDVVTERYILHDRLHRWPIPSYQWECFFRVQQTNENGWPIDRLFVKHAIQWAKIETDVIMAKLRKLTGVSNPNSDKQLGPWLRSRGYPFGTLRASVVKQVMAMPECQALREVLSLRSELKRTSVKKYPRILASLPVDEDLMRYSYQFAGAQRTGRSAARGAQPQNFTKPPKWMAEYIEDVTEAIRENNVDWIRMMYGAPLPVLAAAVRSAARAQEGHQFVIADLSSIETCMTAWIANCKPLLKVFAQGLDPYIQFASQLYRVPYDQVTKEMREICKSAVLSCVFGTGGGEERLSSRTGDWEKTGFWGYAEKNGVIITQEEAQNTVDSFRELYPEVVQTWYDVEKAAKRAVRTGKRVEVVREENSVLPPLRVPMAFDMSGPFLRFHLPSGRTLHYLRPLIENVRTPWGEYKWTLTYEGKEDDEEGHSFWGRTPTRGSKIFQNGVQAVANDQLRVGVAAAYERGFSVRGESHDELITHERIGSKRHTVAALIECVTQRAEWAEGLPLKAAGFTSIIYKKD